MTDPTTKPESDDPDKPSQLAGLATRPKDFHELPAAEANAFVRQCAAKRADRNAVQTSEVTTVSKDKASSSTLKEQRREAALCRPSEVARSSVPLPVQERQGVDASAPALSTQALQYRSAPTFKSVGEILGDLFDDFL